MRIQPNPMPDMLAALAEVQKQEQTALEQVASGRRVNRPSDDPAAAALLVGNQADLARNDTFTRSAQSVRGAFSTADAALGSTVQLLTRAVTLGVEGANGTLSASDRMALVQEIQGIQASLVSLANTSYQGNFLFGGTESGSAPFVQGAGGGVSYGGNAGVNQVEVGNGRSLDMNLPGDQIFLAASGNVFQAMSNLAGALQTGNGVDTAVASVRQAFDAVTAQRVFYGNQLNQLDSNDTLLQSTKLELQRQQTDMAGVDTAQAASNLTQAENARNAVLAAVGKISQLSLLDYLK